MNPIVTKKQLMTEAIKAGIGVYGKVGAANSHLFNAPRLNEFAIKWLEKNIKAGLR